MSLLADTLTWAGTAVCVLAGLRLAATSGAAGRLHAVAPVTALGAPLLLAGLALRPWSSWHDVVKIAVIGVLLAATGPATVVTAGQAVARTTPDKADAADNPGGREGGPPETEAP
ncbi:monovalent cation/H(+) antiporter subunit G [Actinomadura violacea]|uniref:Monovalent cation/H(+) antiporter subunit G n=1 Tax=Actinomadura violacea TaxID=2819934 RepID=A0ABS3RY19_9ACTN|nr:monovalent cation/H(+) antiporter subunit G [Actinomadura violacea]MBO2460914.1 monovalent cation/H(+) antiporter subunit G [Actinomadura violacea]